MNQSNASVKNLTKIAAPKQLKSVFEEFKNFAFKGNVIDMAVGVIIGAAFGKIVDSLVKNILMPFIAILIPGDQGYLGWKFVAGNKDIPYGLFLGELVNFLIVAFALYLFIVKFMGFIISQRNKSTPAPTEPVETPDQKLLKEIRDLLAQKK